MADVSYLSAHISQIPTLRAPNMGDSEWKPVRHHFGIAAFGVNAYVAGAQGERIVPEHDERADPETGGQEHEELYYVGSGHATFTIGGEAIDAPAGTFVFIRDPAVLRSAVALQPGTMILAVGAQPGVAFQVSAWERKKTGG